MVQVYISAPFRTYADEMEGREYGVITTEDYMRFLESIEQLIRSLGFDVCLPHREQGRWGSVYIPPEDVTQICFDLIKSSDILVVFPGKSRGVHIEIGYAAALGKTFLVFLSRGEKESTLLRGISRVAPMSIFRYQSLAQVKSILKDEMPKLVASTAKGARN